MPVLSRQTAILPITHADALPAGTRLAEFEVLGLIGVGGFGMVYQAFDHSLQRPVAIKEYMPAALAGRVAAGEVAVRQPADQAAFQAGLDSFVTEARLLAQFDHPSLVKVFRYWEGHHTAYMVMPLYRGITLQAARSQMRSPPTEAWLRKVLWAVLGALKTLHQGRAVHRDVSPDNIFLQDIGPPVLLDLGAARHAIGGKTEDLTDAFKLSYAPLEQHAGASDMRQGPWTDLYALAAVVHGLLCNKPPLPATFRAVRDRLPPVDRVARTVQEQFGTVYSPAFVHAIGQALAINPQDRPPSVQALVQAMGLETPNGMSRFDWRAELGDIWVPPGLSDQPLARPVPANNTRLNTTDRAELTQPLAAPVRRREAVPVSSPAEALVRAKARDTWFSLPWRVGASVIALAALVVPVTLWTARSDKGTEPGLATSTPAEVAKNGGTNTASLAPAPVVLLAPSEPVVVPLLPPARPAAASARLAPRKPAVLAETGSQLPQPVAAPMVAATDRVEAATPARAASPDPRQLCVDSNFMTRPMCIFRQCQKAEMAGLALCVENNAQMQTNRKFEGF